MTPSEVGQRVRVRPDRLDCTELRLDGVYVVRKITFYTDDQPTKVFLENEHEAIYAADWFEVIE